MVTVEKDVRLLVKKELATVNEDFPLFASAYEGWAKVRAALAGVETERYMLEPTRRRPRRASMMRGMLLCRPQTAAAHTRPRHPAT